MRIKSADAIRGFSLFGILMANLLIFQFGLSGKEHIEYYQMSPVNYGFYQFVKVVFEGSFMPIFAILFGFSMDKLFQSMKKKEMKWKRLKLLFIAIGLIILGLLHSYFIWEGDILLAYGVAMIIVIPFISLPTWFYRIISYLIIGTLLLLTTASFFVPSEESVASGNEEEIKSYMTEMVDSYQNGTYSEIFDLRQDLEDPIMEEEFKEMDEIGPFVLLVAVFFPALGFMFGIYLSRVNWFQKDAFKFWSNKIFIYLIPVCIIIKSSIYWLNDSDLASNLNLTFGLLLAFSFMCLIKYLYQKYENSLFLTGMKSIGKLSLSMYILQSIFGTLVFYGYGLGLFGKDIFMVSVFVFIAFYILQMYLAIWYLKHFSYGPLEYLLRIITYLRISKKKLVKSS